jgi:hypothetical protein
VITAKTITRPAELHPGLNYPAVVGLLPADEGGHVTGRAELPLGINDLLDLLADLGNVGPRPGDLGLVVIAQAVHVVRSDRGILDDH